MAQTLGVSKLCSLAEPMYLKFAALCIDKRLKIAKENHVCFGCLKGLEENTGWKTEAEDNVVRNKKMECSVNTFIAGFSSQSKNRKHTMKAASLEALRSPENSPGHFIT